MFDLRFECPSRWILAGSSGCGKTTAVLNICRFADTLFKDGRCKQNIIYFYKEWQPQLEMFKKENIVHKWIAGKPTVELVHELTDQCKDSGGSIIVIDDFATELDKEIAQIFKSTSHHTASNVLLLSQNLYEENMRGISLNATYIMVFKNPRDRGQITHFARQIAPHNSKYIIEAYMDATQKPYSYLLFDNHQDTHDLFRIRTNVLPHELPIKVYYEKECYERFLKQQ